MPEPITMDMNTMHPMREFLDRVDKYLAAETITGTMMCKVLALDPGETTGWSLFTCDPVTGAYWDHYHGQIDCGSRQGALDVGELETIDSGSMNSRGEALGVERILRLVDENPTVAIVVEDFIVDMRQITKSRSALSPVRITARLQQGLWHRGMDIMLQERSNPKVTMNDDRLKEIGAYQRAGGLQHARDADRHGIYFLRRCQNSAELRHKAWPWAFGPAPLKKTKRKKKPEGERIVFGD